MEIDHFDISYTRAYIRINFARPINFERNEAIYISPVVRVVHYKVNVEY